MINLRNKCVLVIDDDSVLLRALEKVLADEGCHVTCATRMGDAIEILAEQEEPFDLVITDLWMPFVTGLSGLQGIRHLFPYLPVIVLTGFSSPDVKAACLRRGAAAVLEKPLNTPQLLTAVESVFASQQTGP